MVNEKDRYVRCPRSQWRGWEVRTGGGLVRDEDISTVCLFGDEEIQPTTSTLTTTSITTTTTTTSTTTVTTTSTTTATTSTTTTTINPELEGKQKGFSKYS